MNIVSFTFGQPRGIYEVCTEYNRHRHGANYAVIELPGGLRGNDAAAEKDRIAFRYIAEVGQCIIADADLILFDKPRVEGNAFAHHNGVADVFLFTCTPDFARWILSEKEKRGIPDRYGWPRVIMRSLKLAEIPKSYYYHCFNIYRGM